MDNPARFENEWQVGGDHQAGDDDPIVPVESVVEAQQVFPDADLVVMAGENHGFTDAGDIRVAKLSTLFIKEHSTK